MRFRKSDEFDPPSEFIREITMAQPAIAAYVRALLPGYPDYMDILQEVNITLWQKRGNFRDGTHFKAWAFQVARFHVMHVRRKLAVDNKRRMFSEEFTEWLAEAANHVDESLDQKLTTLQDCLGQLRPKDRELLSIRYSRRGSIENYARQHQRNAGTVRATLRRLREILLRCVQDKLPPHDHPA
ncbi:sigma-70 family RNA polymerase sigma factor [Luteolibacter ambystomatis]|uniref:Sigma-70 family RNA polymerase sigma factor n=1 Tax=Luteolibacter ambystomatis TaxID=2824561 RepID=A0A975G8W6_9BACT|nr:sigma-70 family RNA polymerase sigma factor [Luteolibacter ambystomatis]QUE51514.1 sigma-70 family RNA polymerase sigma factor [Luteolibacter ambystomatis]